MSTLSRCFQRATVGTRRAFLRTLHPASSRVRTMASQAEAQGWAQQDERRMLRAVYRVEDVDASVEYYKKHFGMQLLRQDGEGRAAVLGYGAEAEKFALELTGSGDGGACDLGKGFGHFGLVVEDAYQTCDNIKAEGGKVTREAGPVKGGKTVIAFVEDPTGYKWELLQRPASPEPICQVMLRVADLDKSIKWYQDVLGMQLIRKRENEAYKYTLAFMGYGPEESSMVFELTYNWGTDEPYKKGNAYSHVAIGTQDCSKTLKQIKECGGEVIGEPDSTSLTCLDPDGYKVVFVNSADLL